jgi:hypothetical protein
MGINALLPEDGFNGVCQKPSLENKISTGYLSTSEIFLCPGLKNSGNPRKPMETGKSTKWWEINVCLHVYSSERSSLSAHWFYEGGLEFAGTGVFKQVYLDEYVAFSLEEAISCSDYSFFRNYLAQEMKLGYIPLGRYYVEIRQGEKILDTLVFYVDH